MATQTQEIENLIQEKIRLESIIQSQNQEYEQLQQESYTQFSKLQEESQEQAQEFYKLTVQLTEENNKLQTQIQLIKKTKDDLEENLESEIEVCQKKLKSSKGALEDLQQDFETLVKQKKKIEIEFEEVQEQLKKNNQKYKTLEEEYEMQKSKQITGSADQEIEKLKILLRNERNKNESLNVELAKLQKIIEQKEYDNAKQKQSNEDEKKQLETQLSQVKKELQNITTKKTDLQNQLQLIQDEKQQLNIRNKKLNEENEEKGQTIIKEQEFLEQLETDRNKLKQESNQKGIVITSLTQQLHSLNETLEKVQTDFREMQKTKTLIERAKQDLEIDHVSKMKEEQNKNQLLTQEKEELQKVIEHLKIQSANYDQQLEASQFKIYILKRQIKPLINQKIIGLIENFSLKFKQTFSKFIEYPDTQTQDYQFELFQIKVDNQPEFDKCLFKYQNLQQLSKYVSLKSLGVQTIKKTIQPETDNTFFEGHIFQITQASDLANHYDPNLKTKTFLMKTIKTLKSNGYQPKSGDEGKQLLMPNFASMSIFDQFIAQLKNKGVNLPSFKFPQQYIMQAQTENDKYFYHIEELVDGELLKLNSSNNHLKNTSEAQFSNSLVYYSLHKLQEKAMLTNIIGIKSADGTITIYDTVLCTESGLSSDIDLGNEEMIKTKELIEKGNKSCYGDFYDKVTDEIKK